MVSASIRVAATREISCVVINLLSFEAGSLSTRAGGAIASIGLFNKSVGEERVDKAAADIDRKVVGARQVVVSEPGEPVAKRSAPEIFREGQVVERLHNQRVGSSAQSQTQGGVWTRASIERWRHAGAIVVAGEKCCRGASADKNADRRIEPACRNDYTGQIGAARRTTTSTVSVALNRDCRGRRYGKFIRRRVIGDACTERQRTRPGSGGRRRDVAQDQSSRPDSQARSRSCTRY